MSRRPRRILALSGGGVRGIVEAVFLERIEAVYRDRHGPDTRLCDVFDLIGGTSTGAIIAAALALGKSASEILAFYLERAPGLFRSDPLRPLGLVNRFDADRLEREIRREVGDITLGDPAIRTRLALVMKRLDTGSPWIVSNLPDAPYFEDPADGSFIGNRHLPLARIVRASAAAPVYFAPQTLEIVAGEPPGVFVDGGASPYNDPSLPLLMLARMKAYGLGWPLGPDELFLLSIGTGRFRKRLQPRRAARALPLHVAANALIGVIGDCEVQSLAILQAMGRSLAPERINSEVGDLSGEEAFGPPQFSYLRLNVPLESAELREFGTTVSDAEAAGLQRMDDPRNMPALRRITEAVCARRYDLDSLLL